MGIGDWKSIRCTVEETLLGNLSRNDVKFYGEQMPNRYPPIKTKGRRNDFLRWGRKQHIFLNISQYLEEIFKHEEDTNYRTRVRQSCRGQTVGTLKGNMSLAEGIRNESFVNT
jgi:hypothetical protein